MIVRFWKREVKLPVSPLGRRALWVLFLSLDKSFTCVIKFIHGKPRTAGSLMREAV